MDNEFAIGKNVYYDNKIYKIKSVPRYVPTCGYWSVTVTDGYIETTTNIVNLRLIPDSEEVSELKSKNKYYKQLLKEVLPIINVINPRTIDNLDLTKLSEKIFQVVVKD